MNNLFSRSAALAALVLAAGPTHAANFTLSGRISVHNAVVHIDFSLANAGTNVAVWSDSWLSGLNFDPVSALWVASAGDHILVTQVDDDDTIGAGQGGYDTGFRFANLAPGQYRVSLAASFNTANGTRLSQGFAYDTQTPILLTEWNQPSYDPNANDQKGGFWRLNFSNVDGVSVVPEPTTWALMTLGLAGLTGLSAHRRRAGH